MPDTAPKSAFFPADNSAVTSHVTMLQGIISRLAGNSASCKTWCLTLVGALLSFAAAMKSPSLTAFGVVPILIFSCLDAMYLAQERAYRDLFTEIVTKVRDGTYALSDTFKAGAAIKKGGFWRALTSWSIWPVYGSLLLGYAVAVSLGCLHR